MTQTDLAWIAGFFEADGSAGIYRNGGTQMAVRVSIAQKERAILMWVKSLFGGYVTYHRSNKLWSWNSKCRLARNFLGQVQPFLKTRHKVSQVKNALQGV